MQKIDIHTHILPEKFPEFVKRYGSVVMENHQGCGHMLKPDGSLFRKVSSNCWDPHVRIEECHAQDIGIQVLSTIPVLFNYNIDPHKSWEISKFLNDHIAQTVETHPKNFIGLGTLPLQDMDLCLKELERLDSLGMRGIEIGTHLGKMNLNEEYFYPLYRELSERKMALFVHPWDMMGQDTMGQYWLPWLVGMPAETSRAICSFIFGGIFEKFPHLSVAFAHGGGSFPFTIGRIEHGYNVRPDLCATDCESSPKNFLGKFFVDSLVHDPVALDYLIDLIGAENVCLGSDYPFPLGESPVGRVLRKLDVEKMELICYKNAKRWLNL